MTKEQLLKVIEDNTICGSDEERILKALTKYCRKEMDETAYWKERCEAAEAAEQPIDGCKLCKNNKPGYEAGLWCINNCIAGSKFEAIADNWQRLKNQSPIKPDAFVSNGQDD